MFFLFFVFFKDPPEGRRSGDGPVEWLFCHFSDSIVPWGGWVSLAWTEGPVKVQTNVESAAYRGILDEREPIRAQEVTFQLGQNPEPHH